MNERQPIRKSRLAFKRDKTRYVKIGGFDSQYTVEKKFGDFTAVAKASVNHARSC